jgi:hypothetical protein
LFNIDGHLTTTTKKVDLNPFDSGNFMIVKFVLKDHVRLFTNNMCMLTVLTIVFQFHTANNTKK